MKKYFCCQCDKFFSLFYSLCWYNWIKYKGIRKVYVCLYCLDFRCIFIKCLMLEKYVQLMYGIKDFDLKEMIDVINEEEIEIKEDIKVFSFKWKLEELVLEFRFF